MTAKKNICKNDKMIFVLGFLVGMAFTIGSIALISVVLAQSPPCPIGVTLNAVPASGAVGLLVELKDASGIVIAQTISNEYGEVLFELGGVAACTNYEAVIVTCADNPICHKMVGFNPAGFVTWDLTPVITVPTTTTTEVTTTTIQDCPVCPDCPAAVYDWSVFMTGGTVMIFLAAIATSYGAYKGKVRIQFKEKYLTLTGRWSYRWKTIFERSE